MAAVSRVFRAATKSRILTPSLKQWTPGPRRYRSISYGGTSYGSFNKSTLSVLLATVIPIVVGSWLASIVSSCIHINLHTNNKHLLWYALCLRIKLESLCLVVYISTCYVMPQVLYIYIFVSKFSFGRHMRQLLVILHKCH